ncbi:MAG: thioredoxin family protein [Tissierellia bacterium]|jgi:glutaredoxin|nr:thioredoxin family protein [Tissierellia bacterium]
MKKVQMFYLENCPHCRRAFKMIDEIKSKDSKYSKVEIECIDETKEAQIANAHNYYYVPTFYVDGIKLHEGVPTEEKIEKVFQEAIK